MENTISVKGKSNKAFMILSALGILFVVDSHTKSGIGLFTAVFPYDSFFMPLFMFVSGYFFKEKYVETFLGTFKYIKNKFVKLMVPYLLWTVAYGAFILVINKFNFVYWSDFTLDNLLSVFTSGVTFNINSAAWFVPTLFSVVAVYAVIRKLFYRLWNDIAAFALFVLLGAVSVALSKRQGFVTDYTLLLLKTGFFMQFYEFGIFFKKYLEKWFDSVSTLVLCLCMISINLVFLVKYDAITFVKCADMSGFVTDNYFLPFMTSLTGIFFWLKIAKWLSPILGNNKIVNYISNNTFFIMIHHLLFVNAFSALLYFGMKLHINAFSGFDTESFRQSPWYIYAPSQWMKVAYFLFSIISTLIVCKLFDVIMLSAKRMCNKFICAIQKNS